MAVGGDEREAVRGRAVGRSTAPHRGPVDADPEPSGPSRNPAPRGDDGPDRGEEPAAAGRVVRFGFAKLMPDVDRPRAWLLTVDGAPQSYVDLDEPTHLEFEYARRFGHIVDTVAESDDPLDVLHLGGGALTLPRYVLATRPGSRQVVVEADTGLTEFVDEHLPLPRDAGVEVLPGDARELLGRLPEGGTDLLLVDVFGGSRVPAHLTTLGFLREARRVLRRDGVYAANLADGPPLAFARAQVATLRAVFPQVCLIAEAAVLRGRRFGNVVLLGSHRELPAGELAGRLAGDPFPARLVQGPRLERFAQGAVPVDDAAAVVSPDPPEGAFGIG